MSEGLRVLEDGTVVADKAAQQQLAERPGGYALVPSVPGMLLAVDDSAADDGPPGSVVLAGDLSKIGFPDLVSLLAQSRMSGVLRLRTPGARRTLLFADGELRGATSMRVGERLGEIAVRLGFVKSAEMEELLAEAEPGRRPGRVAVERGLLSERDLWNTMQEQMTTIFQGIMLETRGTFAFSDAAVENAATVPGLPPAMLLMEVMRRIDEQRRAAGASPRERLEGVLAQFNEAFRDIFATASRAGAGAALSRAAASTFAGESGHAGCFRGVEFGPEGELPSERFLSQFEEALEPEDDPEQLLLGVLSKAVLFLLFVAGEHLDPQVHEALHARVKASVARAVE